MGHFILETFTMNKFNPGIIAATPGVIDALTEANQEPLAFLKRHLAGDWGEVSAGDARENDFSVANSFRILSAYRLNSGVKIWLITEADRSSTTILLPDEY
jgi:hypothetical protein